MNSLHCWFRTPLGRSVCEAECRLLSQWLASVYARRVLQLGAFGRGERPALFGSARQWLADEWPAGPVDIAAAATDLPFAVESMDVVLLVHQLEFSDDPHAVLREAERVLAREGHLIVVGFNPVSGWGLRRLLSGRHGESPWRGRYLTRGRVEDWLKLLGLEVERRDGLMLMPPIRRGVAPRTRRAVERRGARYARWLGGVQVTMAKKRLVGMMPLPRQVKPRLAVIPGGLAQAGVLNRAHRPEEPSHSRSE